MFVILLDGGIWLELNMRGQITGRIIHAPCHPWKDAVATDESLRLSLLLLVKALGVAVSWRINAHSQQLLHSVECGVGRMKISISSDKWKQETGFLRCGEGCGA